MAPKPASLKASAQKPPPERIPHIFWTSVNLLLFFAWKLASSSLCSSIMNKPVFLRFLCLCHGAAGEKRGKQRHSQQKSRNAAVLFHSIPPERAIQKKPHLLRRRAGRESFTFQNFIIACRKIEFNRNTRESESFRTFFCKKALQQDQSML